MNRILYKKIALCFCAALLFFGLKVNGQTDNHFIYIQAKDKKPFYVILNKKVYSSSTIGYLIIPKLTNGKYNLKIGFPKQSDPEREFSCTVNDADVGYSLQSDDNGQVGLLDLQSQKFIASAGGVDNSSTVAVNNEPSNTPLTQTDADKTTDQTTAIVAPPKTTTSFGDMLSSVANDSTLNQKRIVEQPKTEVQNQNTTTGTITVQPEDFGNNPQADTKSVIASSNEKNLKPAVVGSDDQTYGVIKSDETSTGNGQQLTFVLFNTRTTDTVQIIVPGSSQQLNNAPQDSDNESSSSSATVPKYGDKSLALFKNSDGDTVPTDGDTYGNTNSSGKKRKKKDTKMLNSGDASTSSVDTSNAVDNPFYNSANKTSNTPATDANSESSGAVTAPPCDNPVSEKELQKTQKKMLSKGNDDDMLTLADKTINGKCITTSQVKQLGRLFLSDAGRFAFYQDAYAAVSDKQNYVSLQDQLLDSYFKKKFSDMLQNQ